MNLDKFKFRLRSLPNSKTFRLYLDHYAVLFLTYAIFNLVYVCVISDGFEPAFQGPFIIAIPIIFIHVYSIIETGHKNVSRDDMKDAIVHIRLNHTQSLLEKLEQNPEMLKVTYQNKSLLYWAKHYKNAHANSIIINQMRKVQK